MSEYMLMLTSDCNLNCPYCFAVENMMASKQEMSLASLKRAVDFKIGKNNSTGIGIIGGEPTIHSHFDELMSELILNNRVESIDLFTNGTTIKDHLNVLTHQKMHLLINCNSNKIMGDELQTDLIKGVEELYLSDIPKNQIGFGVNIFDLTDDYSFFFSLLDRFRTDCIRVSVSVPLHFSQGGEGRMDFFRMFLEHTKKFTREILDRGIVPIFDCNKIPPCLLEGEEVDLFERYKNKSESMDALLESNYLNGLSRCSPSIVVDQDLNAIRCFGLSKESRVSINDFQDFDELKQYYEERFDCFGYDSDFEDCNMCISRLQKKCMGGCLGFKSNFLNRKNL